jgi:glucosamine kinase
MQKSGFVIGVDGGGTKTVGRLADLQGTDVASHAVGPTNPNLTGVEESARTLCNLIRHLCAKASCRPGDLKGIVLGLAGASAEKLQQEIREHITRCLHEEGTPDPPLQVVTDVRIALEGAFGGEPGIAVIAGTGSSIMYKNAQGAVGLMGGWGRILGDEGSGYFIGLEALKAVTRDYDGRGSAPSLREGLAARFGLASRSRIIEAVYRQQFPIPSIAPFVLDLAARADDVSCRILKHAASLLADQVGAALSRIGEGPVSIVLSGGLVETATPYRDILMTELTSRFPTVHVLPPRFSPEQGAVLMALPLRREEPGM